MHVYSDFRFGVLPDWLAWLPHVNTNCATICLVNPYDALAATRGTLYRYQLATGGNSPTLGKPSICFRETRSRKKKKVPQPSCRLFNDSLCSHLNPYNYSLLMWSSWWYFFLSVGVLFIKNINWYLEWNLFIIFPLSYKFQFDTQENISDSI